MPLYIWDINIDGYKSLTVRLTADMILRSEYFNKMYACM